MTNQSRNRLKRRDSSMEDECSMDLIEETGDCCGIMRDYQDCNLIVAERTLSLLGNTEPPPRSQLSSQPLVSSTMSPSYLSTSRRKRVHEQKLASPLKMWISTRGLPLTFLCLLASLLIIPSPAIAVVSSFLLNLKKSNEFFST